MTSKTSPAIKAITYDVTSVFTTPLAVMLLAGDVHRWAHAVPLLSYWQTFWPVVLLISVVDGIATRNRYYERAGL